VRAQLGSDYSSIPKRLKTQIIDIARDSLRTALELAARCASAKARPAAVELIAALEDLRENQLAASQRTLQRYHPDFREMMKRLRNQVVTERERIRGPVLLRISQSAADDLFASPSRVTRFIAAGLRCGALCMRAGDRWVPGLHPTDVEIPPLLLWQKGDPTWSPGGAHESVVSWEESDVFRKAGGPRRPPSVFVAYRMESEESKRFRQDIEEAVEHHPEVAHYRVTDGRVPPGAEWPTVIRERIRDARAVIGDVTGMRPDVLFELGFAYGLGRIRIPAVSGRAAEFDPPPWLGATQLGEFGDSEGLMRLVSALVTHVSDPEFLGVTRPPQAVPGLVIWLREFMWNRHPLSQFKTTIEREALKLEVMSEDVADERLIRRAASANLLVASVDGTGADAFVHYVCGAIAAKPRAGHGKILPRTVLILEEPALHEGSRQSRGLVANSLRRCQDVVRIIQPGDILIETKRFIETYKKWLRVKDQ